MQLTPNESFEHIKESIVQYLETQYRISHPKIFSERGEILRRDGVVAQQPFIEATPSFPTAHKLSVLEDMYPDFIPQGISELVQHGIPIDKYDLYTLQEEAILAAFSEKPSLLVATGTGSGKTSFLNVVSNFFPPSQRIISIEDTRELKLPETLHWVPMRLRLTSLTNKSR